MRKPTVNRVIKNPFVILILMASLLFAMPASTCSIVRVFSPMMGDVARYQGKYTKNKIAQNFFREVSITQDWGPLGAKYLYQTTEIINGLLQVSEKQMEGPGTSLVLSLFRRCEITIGKSVYQGEIIKTKVLAGEYDSCHLTWPSKEGTVQAWFADVPLAIIKYSKVSPSGDETSYELESHQASWSTKPIYETPCAPTVRTN